MADRCPTCQRPVPAPADFDPTRHCPRLMGWPLGPSAEHTIACMALGIVARDTLIAEQLSTLKSHDELLRRSRDLLIDVTRKLDQALDLLPAEVTGG